MNYQEQIEKAINYIEANLKNDIDITACAQISGYSVYHFLRIFKDIDVYKRQVLNLRSVVSI